MTSERRRTARAKGLALRVSLLYAAIFVVVGNHMPYMPVWLNWRGLSSSEIAIVLAAPLFGRVLFTPFVSFLADRSGDYRRVLIVLAWGSLICFLALNPARSFWLILTILTVQSMFWTSVMPLSEVVAMAGVRAHGLDYGRMRVWGSLTFILASIGGGVTLQALGAGSVVWILSAGALCTVGAAYLVPPRSSDPKAALARKRINAGDALALARAPVFVLFVLSASAVNASHAVLYTFGSLHWQAQGLSSAWIGSLWAIGVLAEIVVFAFSARVLRSAAPVHLIAIGALAALVRWPVMAFDPPLALLIACQVLHGATFGMAHLGAIHFIGAAIPEHQAGTAQGLYASVSGGIVMGLATVAAGPLYAALGANAFAIMALPGVIAVIGCWWVQRIWDGGMIGGPARAPLSP